MVRRGWKGRQLLAAAVVLLVLLVSFAGWVASRSCTPGGAPGRSATAAVSRAVPVRRGPHPRAVLLDTSALDAPGARYALELSNQFEPGAHAGGTPAVTFAVSGELSLIEVELEDAARTHELQLSKLQFVVDAGETQWLGVQRERSLAQALEQPFYVTTDGAGRVQALRFSRKLDGMAEGLLRFIAAALQFVSVESDEDTSWQTWELDPVGSAIVSYRKLAENQFVKHKLRYEKILTADGLQPAREAGIDVGVRGETRVQRDLSRRRLVELVLAEQTETSLGEAKLLNRAELSLGILSGLPSTEAVARWQRARGLTALSPQRASALRAMADASQPDDGQPVGPRTFDELLAAALTLSEDDEAARSKLQEQLEGLLRSRPDVAREIPRAVRTGDERTSSILISALANAGTAQAQSSLGEIVHDQGVELTRRETALALLGTSEAPTEGAAQAVHRVLDDPNHPSARTARLALGNLARTFLSRRDPEGERLFKQLADGVRAATSADERALRLAALGNVGDARLIDIVAPYLRATSPEVRAAAAWALRFVEGDSAFAWISQVARGDGDARVRHRAVEALTYARRPGTVELLAAVLDADPSSSVRLEALSVLATLDEAQRPRILAHIAAHDPDPVVRRHAATLQ